jgi:thiamine biosynthesis lipoprotein
VIADSPREGEQFIDIAVEEISRIEQLISSWDTNSQTSLVNKYAGIKPVQVDRELFELIERALSISKLTDGAFDISCAGLNKVWRFDGSMSKVPLPKVVEESIRKINYQNISTNKENRTIFLKERGMKIGFGAIGKGYAADMAKALLIKKGVKSGIINASGDMTTWGRQPNGKEWTVAITNPMNKSQSFALLPITNGAVVTSGDYERFVEIDGKKYAHIIDPKTGYPAKGIISVTVFAPKAELADALATSVFVMGIEAGLNRINQLPKVECIIIDAGGKIHKSENIKIEKI